MQSEAVIVHYPIQASVPIRNDANYAGMVAENLTAVTAIAQEQMGKAAEMINCSHCFTLVPSAVIGGGALLFTMIVSFRAALTKAEMAELASRQGVSGGSKS